jgi:hypothetical protein
MRGDLGVHRFFEILNRKGFGDIVHGTEYQCFFDALKVIGAGNHDDFCRGTDFGRSGEDIKSVEPGAQIDIEQHAFGLQLLEQPQGFAGRRRRENLAVEAVLKMFLQQTAKVQFVIHDQQFNARKVPLELRVEDGLNTAVSLMSLR